MTGVSETGPATNQGPPSPSPELGEYKGSPRGFVFFDFCRLVPNTHHNDDDTNNKHLTAVYLGQPG